MYKRLYEYISVQCPLYKFQFGFRKYHSTALALIAVMDEIYQQLDSVVLCSLNVCMFDCCCLSSLLILFYIFL